MVKSILQLCIRAAKKILWNTIKLLSESNYYSARAFYKYQLYRSQRRHKEPPLLVYQMGKVGSSTVVTSLNTLGLDMPIYHPHFLTKTRIAETEAKRKKHFRTERYSYLKRPWMYQFLRKQIDHGINSKKWKIVTLTREPIARNISTFFENLKVVPLESGDEYEIKSDYYNIDPTIVKLDDMQIITHLFFEKLNHDSPLVFFDRELRGVFGIDVFASEFPKSKGYEIYENERAKVLLIRLEDLNNCAKKAFKDFLHIDNFTVVNTNIGAEKVYSAIYNKFKETVVFPDSYLDKFYNSQYMTHFYNKTEIDRYRAKWRRH